MRTEAALISICVVANFSIAAWAQGTTSVESVNTKPGQKCETVSGTVAGAPATGNLLICQQGANAFKGLHWGLGILYSSNLGGVGPVITVPNGAQKIVRVTQDSASAARAAFELHYFWPFKTNVQSSGIFGGFKYAPAEAQPSFGFGPFVSLNSKPLNQLQESTVFSSLGVGLMVGANAFIDDTWSHSVNLGLGARPL